ncbi:MAG: hypothetical protein ACTSU5_16840 [Promethearchaeota archaeon]
MTVTYSTYAYYEKNTGDLIKEVCYISENKTADPSVWQFHKFTKVLAEKDGKEYWSGTSGQDNGTGDDTTEESPTFFQTPAGIAVVVVSIAAPAAGLGAYAIHRGRSRPRG